LSRRPIHSRFTEGPADEAPDPFVLRAERRLRLLEELAEIGMELARALKPGVAGDVAGEEAASGAKSRDPADAYARLSRAVRLTFALEAKTDQALRDLKSGVAQARESERAQAAERATAADARDRMDRRDRVQDIVMGVAEAESEDAEECRTLCQALHERLEEDEAYLYCEEWPVRVTVERLCKDLGLTPDPSRWDGEEWIEVDFPARFRFSPFNQPSARPLLKKGHAPPPAPVSSWSLEPAAHHLE